MPFLKRIFYCQIPTQVMTAKSTQSPPAAMTIDIQCANDEKSILTDDQNALPKKYREEILRQYDLPTKKATVLDIFHWATPLDTFLMLIGTLMAIAAGT